MALVIPPTYAEDLWTVACTLYGEARGEPRDGQRGVAWVIRNRQQVHPTWEGMTLAEICVAPYQFSCWLSSDPNCAALQQMTLETEGFPALLRLAMDVILGVAPSNVGESTHYHATYMNPKPSWAQGEEPYCQLGNHYFYQNIP